MKTTNTNNLDFTKTSFVTSANSSLDLPADNGSEVAFVGCSNVGKSSAINAICARRGLAKSSKTPGRTQLINFFNITATYHLVDLPGYGFAKVAKQVQRHWQIILTEYLQKRAALRGIILLLDIRHPLKPLDWQMLEWCRQNQLSTHILLTKTDKLSTNQAKQTLFKVEQALAKHFAEYQPSPASTAITLQLFSAQSKLGVDNARAKITELLLSAV